MRGSFLLMLSCLATACYAFSAVSSRTPLQGPVVSPLPRITTTKLFLSDEPTDQEKKEETSSSTPPEATTSTNVVPEPVQVEEESSDVPIDLPSPLLLGSSIILGIVSTGSLFDLIGGNPSLGFAPTAAIALGGLPVCLFLFIAAIKKGQAETEEDNERFKNSGGF